MLMVRTSFGRHPRIQQELSCPAPTMKPIGDVPKILIRVMRERRITMEDLQKSLVTKIGEQLKTDSPNIQLLDVLNRLLGTVSNWLISKK